MSTITTRAGKGSPLTHDEVDENFTNLNSDKYEAGDSPSFGSVAVTGTVDGRDIAADGSKLDGIEAGADVTDTANVTAAGALMDSEVTNLADVKAFDPADYATAAQGNLADSSVQPGDSPSFGSVAVTGTVDGRDVASDGTKLDGIETGADVTDTANVTAAGALMDSEVTNLADVKAFDPADYATAAQGNLADSSVQPGDSPSFGSVTVTGTVDGRDVAADGSKLDGIEAGADVTDTANVTAAGALMDSEVTNLADVKAFDQADYATAAQGSLADSSVQPGDSPSFGSVTVTGTVDGRDVAADGSKLDGIEAGADVTDTANVTAAGALMDSEVTNLAAVKTFDSADYATAAQGSLADRSV